MHEKAQENLYMQIKQNNSNKDKCQGSDVLVSRSRQGGQEDHRPPHRIPPVPHEK